MGVRSSARLKSSPRQNVIACASLFSPNFIAGMDMNSPPKIFVLLCFRTRHLLQTLPGRAALLSGGIIGRIAREFLQPDEVLDGPSVEATFARNGPLCGCRRWQERVLG